METIIAEVQDKVKALKKLSSLITNNFEGLNALKSNQERLSVLRDLDLSDSEILNILGVVWP